MTTEPSQKITSLTNADRERLQDQRAVAEKALGDESFRRKYPKAAGKLGTIRAVLAAGVFKPNLTYELQCRGIVLADRFVLELKMEWVDQMKSKDTRQVDRVFA